MEFSVYLMFNGNCEAAINFYKEALGANLLHLQRFGESDMPDIDPVWKDKILHCGIEKEGFIIMGSDSKDSTGGVVRGDNVQLSINHTSEEEIDKTFAAISAGGNITMPLQDTFWGAKFGMCVDKFGVSWMFNFDRPKGD
ncbi:MAG: VOC family protein [Chitinophagaceae bacterium]